MDKGRRYAVAPPDKLPGTADLLAAFWEISNDRQSGFGPGAIPFAAIDRWAQRYGITDHDAFDEFVGFVRVMDAVYLDMMTPGDPTAPKVSGRALSPDLFDAIND